MATKKKTVKKKTAKKAVKKAVKKKAVKKVAEKKVVAAPKVSKKAQKTSAVKTTKSRINMVLRDLLTFLIFTLISYLLYMVSSNVILNSFFFIAAWILGFISLAFLISLLVLVLLRAMKK